MATRHVSIEGIDGWIDGLNRLGDRVGDKQVDAWQQATERMYDRTQQFVHILSGDLIASGRHSLERGRRDITGMVTYGGTKACDYAIFEFARGGSHDALNLGFVANIPVFEQAIVDGIAAEIDSWG